MTGKLPFPEARDTDILPMVSKGKRPQKPRDFDAPGTSKAVWKVAEKCWHNDVGKRPEVKEVLQRLDNIDDPGECMRGACFHLG